MPRKTKANLNRPVPQPVLTRSGCKVGWEYYRTKEEAEYASARTKQATRNALAMGYDFGYCSPGAITRMPDGAGEYAGLWEVCIP